MGRWVSGKERSGEECDSGRWELAEVGAAATACPEQGRDVEILILSKILEEVRL